MKKNINGVKKNESNYTGNVKGIIKKIIALALSLGLAITAGQAIKMYNEWKSSKSNEDRIEDTLKEKTITMEDVKSLIAEYNAAKDSGNEEKMKELNEKLNSGNYFGVLLEEYNRGMVEALGYDYDDVYAVAARDGVFLVDRQKAQGKVLFTSNGTINSKVKFLDKSGKNPSIPYELRIQFEEIGERLSIGVNDVSNLESCYEAYNDLENYRAKDIDER